MLPLPLLTLLLLLTPSPVAPVSLPLRSIFRRADASEDHPINLPPQSEIEPGSVVCRPFGVCEPCPAEALSQPYCQPFGNRRLIHCLPYSSLPQTGEGTLKTGDDGEVLGETPAWEACGKVVSRELADFWEFVMFNLVLLAIAGAVYLLRSRKLAALQYRQLVARIGLSRGTGWQDG
ncbi:hypothetical protein DACRYDRAFT_110099 [Dacryopinax primogenitus]|uniref:Uncharacterized protein n=1 Tax=Dacryopinax primogenitus (strain DJM 731) TaxID=1858805 RepID=M5FUZ8_DACPD|nr:uncharacterized protein DACRYDRAFT_110099 [Dacryopinax primogenitus]EJT99379.1 hypothetical protein DACRYDRAFT_110099 [Dacryopinax primogenitus]